MSAAPDYAHYFPFLQTLENHDDDFATGLALVFAPAIGCIVFIALSIGILACERC